MSLPRWKSHKVVEAFKITKIERHDDGAVLFGEPDIVRVVSANYVNNHEPQEGGYYVQYLDDGYESWSPAKTFEDGYTKESEA